MTLRAWARSRFATSFTRISAAEFERKAAEHERREREGRRHKLRLEARAERNLAHRELQLVRAQSTGRRGYIAEREAKLESARAELVAVSGVTDAAA
jgi:hypothetical protein